MSTRKTTLVYAVLIAFAAGMVIASRLDLAPASAAQSIAMPAMNSAPVSGALDAQTFRNVAKAQQPMVVNIRTEVQRSAQDMSDFLGGRGGGGLDDFFRQFSPDQGAQPRGRNRRPPTMTAAGTGFIINKDGLILTNNHVVDEATKISVLLYGEESDLDYEAKLVGRDAYSDTALIQLIEKPNHPLPEAKFGDSSQMAAGDWVVAIGNPFSNGWSVTVGVVSATERPFSISENRQTEMIQTDAAINPGNSGGPLLNLRGEVIGMNTAILSSGRVEGNIGIGFAVPANTIRNLIPQLSTGKVVRGRIGVQIQAVPREGYEDFGLKTRTGAIIQTVLPDGAAEKGGLEAGDIILEFNSKTIVSSDELQKTVIATKPGTTVPVKVLRNKREQTLRVTVEELDFEAERQGSQPSAPRRELPEMQGQDSFGLTLSNLTPGDARQLGLPSGRLGAVVRDVDPAGPSGGRLQEDDVILSINDQRVSSAAEAGRELQRVTSGRNARILVWRDGRESFVTIRKD